MQSRSEIAIEKFTTGYNCAQAVACAFADKMNLSEEDAYRLSEGLGGGFGHSGYACGACSAMSLIASYHVCPNMEHPGATKEQTYPIIQKMVNRFIEENGAINCFDIIEQGDTRLVHGKKACCIDCVKSACQQLEEEVDN